MHNNPFLSAAKLMLFLSPAKKSGKILSKKHQIPKSQNKITPKSTLLL
jgi:hypothetical protein